VTSVLFGRGETPDRTRAGRPSADRGSDVSDDVGAVDGDGRAVGIAQDEGGMDSAALDGRHVETNALPLGVSHFEVVHHEIERRIRAGRRRTGQKHQVCAAAQLQHDNVFVPFDLPHADGVPEVR